MAGHMAGAIVTEVRLLRATAGVREVQSHGRAFSFADFPAAAVAHEDCLTSQVGPPGSWLRSANTMPPYGRVEFDATLAG